MKRNCNFKMNPAFSAGLVLMWAGVFVQNVLKVQGMALNASHLACGMGIGLAFVGLLYGSPKTRPLFDRFHAFKMRLLGREGDTPC